MAFDLTAVIKLQDRFTGTMDKVRKSTEKFQKSMDKVRSVGDSFNDVGKKMTKSVTLPIVGFAALSVKAASDFESAFAGVRKTVDATEEEFAVFKDGIREMAKRMPQSAEEIAGVAEAAGQLGIQNDAILSFTETMVNMGVATDMASDDAAMALARFATITQMNQKDFDKLGSTIVGLGNNFAATESEIVQMGLRLAGAGATIGMSEADILSFSAALSAVGINAEAGGTAMSKLMITLANEVATSGDQLDDFAKVAGMSASEFQRAFKQDAAGAITSFIEGLGNVEKSGGNVFGVLEDLGLTEIRLRDALLRSAGASDVLRGALELGSKSWKENTALSEEANERYETFASQLQIFYNRVKDVAITLGESLMPALIAAMDAAQPFIDKLAEMADWFADLDPKMQTMIIGAVALVAALGPLALGISAVIKVGTMLITVIRGAALAVTFLTRAMLMNPYGLIVTGVLALVAGIVLLIKHWDKVKNTAAKVWTFIKVITTTVIESIVKSFNNLWDKMFEAFDKMGFLGDILKGYFNAIKVYIQGVWNMITIIISTAINIIKNVIGAVVNVIKGDWSAAWDNIKNIFTAVWDGIKSIFSNSLGTMIDIGKNLFSGIWEGMKSIWTGMSDWVKGKVSWLTDKLMFWRKGNKEMSDGTNAGSEAVDGSHYNGLWRVPFDGYLARLHKGERVLTADQADAFDAISYEQVAGQSVTNVTNNTYSTANNSNKDRGKSSPGSVNITIAEMNVRSESDIKAIAGELLNGMKLAWEAGA